MKRLAKIPAAARGAAPGPRAGAARRALGSSLRSSALPLFAAASALVAAAACSSAPAEPAGVGQWDVTRTKLADATGRCDPTDLPDGRKGTWCYMQPSLSIGGQGTQVDLYFGGVDPQAPLIELQLKVPACDFDKADAWARTSFGVPFQRAGDRAYWKNRYLYVALMRDDSRCLIRVLPLSEQKEFARIQKLP